MRNCRAPCRSLDTTDPPSRATSSMRDGLQCSSRATAARRSSAACESSAFGFVFYLRIAESAWRWSVTSARPAADRGSSVSLGARFSPCCSLPCDRSVASTAGAANRSASCNFRCTHDNGTCVAFLWRRATVNRRMVLAMLYEKIRNFCWKFGTDEPSEIDVVFSKSRAESVVGVKQLVEEFRLLHTVLDRVRTPSPVARPPRRRRFRSKSNGPFVYDELLSAWKVVPVAHPVV